MWHYRRGFRGKGIFLLIGTLFAVKFLGDAGFPAFLILLGVLWICVPMITAAFSPRSRVRRSRIRLEEIRMRERPARDPQPVRVATVAPSPQPVRSTAHLKPTCSACGGPVNDTTVDWRGERPVCGYCGSGLS